MSAGRVPRRTSLFETEGSWWDRLRVARESQGRGKLELAEVLGMDRSTMSLYEMGRSPRLERFAELCRELNVSADDILGI